MTDRRVFLADCPDYEQAAADQAVRQMLDGLGVLDALSPRGKKVLLKVNLLGPFKPEKAVTTHPAVVQAVAKYFVEAGSEVTIADSPGGPFNAPYLRTVYSICGMDQAAQASGAKLNMDFAARRVQNGAALHLREMDVLEAVLQSDLVVSMAKLKTHGIAYYTGAVKNLYGTIPGITKAAYHSVFPNKEKFNAALVDICEYIKPALSIIDGVFGMEGAGPSGGTPKKVGVLAASYNPYALDYSMCNLVSLPVNMVPVLTEAVRRGLLPEGGAVEMLGQAPETYKTTFAPALTTGGNRLLSLMLPVLPTKLRMAVVSAVAPYPVMTERCIGCARCAEICPRSVIEMVDRRAKPDYSGCIRCYCCHEVCPAKAIDLVHRSKIGG